MSRAYLCRSKWFIWKYLDWKVTIDTTATVSKTESTSIKLLIFAPILPNIHVYLFSQKLVAWIPNQWSQVTCPLSRNHIYKKPLLTFYFFQMPIMQRPLPVVAYPETCILLLEWLFCTLGCSRQVHTIKAIFLTEIWISKTSIICKAKIKKYSQYFPRWGQRMWLIERWELCYLLAWTDKFKV